LVRLVTGCSWDVAARIVRVGESTRRRRRDQWLRAGVFGVLAREALDAYDRVIGVDLSDVAIDGSLHKAPAGGEGTGKNPTDRVQGPARHALPSQSKGCGRCRTGQTRSEPICCEPAGQRISTTR